MFQTRQNWNDVFIKYDIVSIHAMSHFGTHWTLFNHYHLIMLFKWMPLKKRYLYFSLISYSLAWLCIQCMFKKRNDIWRRQREIINNSTLYSIIDQRQLYKAIHVFFFSSIIQMWEPLRVESPAAKYNFQNI